MGPDARVDKPNSRSPDAGVGEDPSRKVAKEGDHPSTWGAHERRCRGK